MHAQCADLQQRGVRLGEGGGEGVGPRPGQRGTEQLGAHAGGERGDQQARVRVLAPGVTTPALRIISSRTLRAVASSSGTDSVRATCSSSGSALVSAASSLHKTG